MENYLNQNFGGVKSKNSSDEVLQRWRKVCGFVKNPKRRFRFTANLSKRYEAEAMRRSIQENLRVAVLVSKAALKFIDGATLSSEYTAPEEVKAAGFQICADELGSIVEGHEVKKLKGHGGIEGIANKLSTSTTDGLTTAEDLLNRRQEVKLNGVATIIGKIGLFFAVVTFAVMMHGLFNRKLQEGTHWIWSGDDALEISKEALSLCSEIPASAVKILLQSIFTNTGGEVVFNKEAKLEILGTPTETALLEFGLSLGGNFQAERQASKLVKVEPFNSTKKRMGVVLELPDGGLRAHCKGASEIILAACDKVINANGDVVTLDEASMNHLKDIIEQFASEALRTLCLAYIELGNDFSANNPIPVTGYTCIGIVGIKDPVRPGVKESVAICRSAGITVRMVTGDNITTAKAIARECGILTDKGIAIEGPEFREKSHEELTELIPKIQVAKESADVIILDDNFSTIVTVAKWGRSVYINIQKFVQFQLTVNVVALIVNFSSACLTGNAPLTAVQLLWVNMIMDTLGALALATEPPNGDLMKRLPVGRKGNFISNVMWRNILGQSCYQFIVIWHLQTKGKVIFHLDGPDSDLILNTLIFNSFVFCQVTFRSLGIDRSVTALCNRFSAEKPTS
ncbi:hypothetical protein HHK36_009782 [Tetracentron sinense]|uniref:P-type Cu(+) transporter n=1 Tax=Tetracentron sinense TaxID=13715 RepID=A0A834ZM39_TETSI|nr:hypothetical protein HHK36_009782 [Tetracentron sinense]